MTLRTMNIIHLSDIHVGQPGKSSRFLQLLDDIEARFTPADSLLLITGDLNENTRQVNRQFSAGQLQGMTNRGWTIRLCPGNHDYGDATRVKAEDARSFQEAFGTWLFGGKAPVFPVVSVVGDCALIGLDSNAGELSLLQNFAAEGCLGHAQIEQLNRLLDGPELAGLRVVVYLHHHPFLDGFEVRADVGDTGYWRYLLGWNTRRFRRLKDAYSLMQCVRDRVDILLFGHQHLGLDYSAESRHYGIPLALDASSSTASHMDTDRMRYRVIDTGTLTFQTFFVRLQ